LLALAMMALVFAATAADNDTGSDRYNLSASDTDATAAGTEAKRTDLEGGSSGPSPVGVLLGVLVLGTGVTVLALGARRPSPHTDESELVGLD
jgi:hypothetical protein